MSNFNQGSHELSGFFFWVMVGCLVQLVSSFNIDIVHPIVYEDPAVGKNSKESYFGYSLQFLFNPTDNENSNWTKWLLVGAPRANSTFLTHVNLTEPGQVYRCPLALGNITNIHCRPLIVESEEYNRIRNLRYKDHKNNGWLGGAMAVNSPSAGRVAVCGYRWVNNVNQKSKYMNGVCYWSNHQVSENENFFKVLPLVDQREQLIGNSVNFGYGQSGFSVHMALKKNGIEEMIIGAPGVFEWTGAVIRVSDDFQSNPTPKPSRRKRQDTQVYEFAETLVSNSAQIKELEPNDYFGYSVHSGIFFNDGKLLYVSGAPRAAGMKGKVLIFDFLDDNDNKMTTKMSQLSVQLELNGTQLGEYFGASILAVDLTLDGKAELLVGAPQHSLQSEMGKNLGQTGDEGIVYFYVNRNGTHLEKQEALYGSRTRDARFGTTMASAGDINGDGFNDVVIGAPYENGKGAIYLYLGDKNGINRHNITGYWQRIAAADFVSHPLNNLKGFGISLVAADMDGNGYPDVAVGSFMSGHALVFRSSPVIQLGIMMNFVGNVIQIDQSKKEGSSVEIRVCSYIQSKFNIKEMCVGYSFYFDAEYINQPRLILNVNGTTANQPYNYTGILTNGSPSCQNFNISLEKTPQNSQDFSRPAIFRMTGKLLTVRPINNQCSRMTDENLKKDAAGSRHIFITGKQQPEIKDTFCAECPVIDETMLDETGIMSVEKFAAFTTECGRDNICDEDLEVTANFIFFNHKELVVGSQNTISFEVRFVNYNEPSYLTTLEITLPSYTNLKRTPADLCQKPIGFSDELMYSCQLRVNPLKRDKSEEMKFELDLTSIPSGGSDNLTVALEARMKGSAARGRQTRYNLTIPLKTDIDVEILGNSVEEQLTYHRSNDTKNSSELNKDRITFKQFYEVRNVLPSTAQVEIEVLIPNSVLSTQGVTLHVIDTGSIFVEATQQGGLSNTTCVLLQQSIDTQKFRESISSSPTVKIQPALKFGLQANRTAFIDCFNTPSVSCKKHVCSTFGPLSTKSPIRISLTGTLLLQNIYSFIDKKDVFIVSSSAQVTIRKPANFKQPSGHKPDVAIASTYFLPQGPPGNLTVASWIIVLAVLAGIILLSLMVVGLQKMGFFERQRYPQDEGLAEEIPTPGEENSEENSVDPDTEQPNA